MESERRNRVHRIMATPDEKTLIAAARDGSTAAFEALVRIHDAAVLRLALRMTRSREDARDVYQDVFLRAYRSIRRFRGDSGLRTWLLRIAAHACLDRRRAGAALRVAGPGRAAEGDDTDPHAHLADPRPDGDPERAVSSLEMRRRLDAALGLLAERERIVFELRHHEGLSLRDIGAALDTTEETARNCLYRAHQRLRRELRDLAPAARRAAGGSDA